MGVRRNLLRKILSSLKYIKNLSEEQIRASLWRGEGTLYDIELEPGKLQELLAEVCPVALEILHVRVDELYIQIPWSQLGTQSVVVGAKNVDVGFNLHCEDEDEWRDYIGPMLRKLRHASQETLAAAPSSLGDPAGTFNQLQKRLLHSLQIQVGHIHVSVTSRHRRHFTAHGHGAPAREDEEPPGDMIDGPPEEAISLEFEDLLLSPCDPEKVPSDRMKAMAVYEPSERVLGLTRLLKCRAFRVVPPRGCSRACPCASEEYMDTPGVMTCFIVDRCTSDGCRICPVLLRTELLFDLPSHLRVKACECQLDAFMAMLSDIGQLEEWRLDESIVGERRSKLLDCSEVARTFARGPEWQRNTSQRQRATAESRGKPPTAESLATSLASGLSAGTSSFWKLVTPEPSKKRPASGFHPVDLPDSGDDHAVPASPVPAASSACVSPALPVAAPAPGAPPAPLVLPAGGPSAAERAAGSSPQMQERVQPLAVSQQRPPASAGAEAAAPDVAVAAAAEGEQAGGASEEHAEEHAYFGEVDEDSDGEDEDFFSVVSRSRGGSSPRAHLSEKGDRKHRRSMPTNWIDAMSSWFGAKPAGEAGGSEAFAECLDLGTQLNRLQVTFSSLAVQLAVPAAKGLEVLEVCGERLSIMLDTQYELTEAQRECVRRFAWPDQEQPPREPRFELPKRASGSQLITWPRFTVSADGDELVRSTDPGQLKNREPMLAVSMRPRSAPPEVVHSQAAGDLMAWPSHLRLAHAFLAVQPAALQEVLEVYKRLKPFLVGKVPNAELIAPAAVPGAQDGAEQRGLFPAQCLSVELCHCEFLEASEARAIAAEQRWPWRGSVPHVVLRSESASWDLSDVLRASAGPAPSPHPSFSPCSLNHNGSHGGGLADAGAEGMVSIPTELFEELVRRAAETTKKDSQVSAAREELQRAYITMASSKRGPPAGLPGAGASSSSGAGSRGKAAAPEYAGSDEDEQDELNQLRQKCLQLEISLQSQARNQKRLESELAHHQAMAQEELRRLLATARGPRSGR